jgi:hypothetical protein
MRVRTLGVAPEPERDGLPPLAELLFPAGAVRSDEVTAWDSATFASWFASRGLRIAGEHRVKRSGLELAALERFPDKLAAIPDEELRTAAVDFTLFRGAGEDTAAATGGGESAVPSGKDLLQRFDAIVPGDDVLEIAPAGGPPSDLAEMEDVKVTSASPEALATGTLEQEGSDAIVCSGALERIEAVNLQDACDALYAALRPGGQLLLGVGSNPNGSASSTAIVVGLLRAGFEVLAHQASAGGQGLQLVRPLELADIAAFSGRR